MIGRIESHLKELGIALPTPPAPVASYVPTVTSGNLVFVSGQITSTAEGLKYVGVVGRDLTVEDGKAAARPVRHQSRGPGQGGVWRSRSREALRQAHRVRERHARFHPAPGSRQRRLRSAGGGFRRGGKTRARRAGRRIAAARRGVRGGSHIRDRVTKISARFAGSAAEIGEAAWNACANPGGGRSASFHAPRILRRAGGIRIGGGADRLAPAASGDRTGQTG